MITNKRVGLFCSRGDWEKATEIIRFLENNSIDTDLVVLEKEDYLIPKVDMLYKKQIENIIIVISKNSFFSEWVQYGIKWLIEKNIKYKLNIISINIDELKLPFYLNNVTCLDITKTGNNEKFKDLLISINSFDRKTCVFLKKETSFDERKISTFLLRLKRNITISWYGFMPISFILLIVFFSTDSFTVKFFLATLFFFFFGTIKSMQIYYNEVKSGQIALISTIKSDFLPNIYYKETREFVKDNMYKKNWKLFYIYYFLSTISGILSTVCILYIFCIVIINRL